MYAALDSCHRSLLQELKQVGDLGREALQIAGENGLVLAEIPLALTRLLAENVAAAAELVTVRNDAVSADLHSLRGSAVRLDLRHELPRLVVFRGVPRLRVLRRVLLRERLRVRHRDVRRRALLARASARLRLCDGRIAAGRAASAAGRG